MNTRPSRRRRPGRRHSRKRRSQNEERKSRHPLRASLLRSSFFVYFQCSSTEGRSMATVQRIDDGAAARRKVTAEILDRQPPRNLEAEKGVLGSIMLMPEVCDEVALIIRPPDFYDGANQKLFAHMQAIRDAGRRVGVTVLVERLDSSGD